MLWRSQLKAKDIITFKRRWFRVLSDRMENDSKLPQFMVGIKNGFLPRVVRPPFDNCNSL